MTTHRNKAGSVLLAALLLAALLFTGNAVLPSRAATPNFLESDSYTVTIEFYINNTGGIKEDDDNCLRIYGVSQSGQRLTDAQTGAECDMWRYYMAGHEEGAYSFTFGGQYGVTYKIECEYQAAMNKTTDWWVTSVSVRHANTKEQYDAIGVGNPQESPETVLWSGEFGMKVKGALFAAKRASCTLTLPCNYNKTGDYQEFYNSTATAVSDPQPRATSFYANLGPATPVSLVGNGIMMVELENRILDQYGCSWFPGGNSDQWLSPITIGAPCAGFSIINQQVIANNSSGQSVGTRKSFLRIDLSQVTMTSNFNVNLTQNYGALTKMTTVPIRVITHTVRFVDNVTGSVLKTEQVRNGCSATPPATGSIPMPASNDQYHYIFTGWTGDPYTNLYSESVSLTRTVYTKYNTATHSFSTLSRMEPTCTAAGFERLRCSGCGYEKTNTIPQLGHQERTLPAVAATCTQSGLTEGVTCQRCGAPIVPQTTVPATGHSWGEWAVTTPATWLAEGELTRECGLCHITETQAIPVLTPDAVASDADTGVSVSFTDEAYAGEVSVSVTPVYDGASFELTNSEIGNYRHMLFDIVTTVDGDEAQPGVPVLVRIPIPEGFNAAYITVYHVTETGLERVPCVVEDGYVCFEASHFSVYTVADESAAQPTQPDTPTEPGQSGSQTDGNSFFAKIAAFFAKIIAFFRGIFNR